MHQVNNLLEDEEASLELCDELIKNDEYDPYNYIHKGNNFTNITRRCKFINDHKEKFEHSFAFLNYLAKNGLDEQYYTKDKPVFNYEALEKIIERSLNLEPSPKNPAWKIKSDLISQKYEICTNKKEKKELHDKIIEIKTTLEGINSTCINFLKLILSS